MYVNTTIGRLLLATILITQVIKYKHTHLVHDLASGLVEESFKSHVYYLFSLVLIFAPANESRKRAEGTLYGELGLCLDGGVGVVSQAGVDAGIFLCEVGDLETPPSQHLHTTIAGDTKQQNCREQGRKWFSCDCEQVFSAYPTLINV